MKQILIENDSRVDIARSDQQVANLAKHGWSFVADLTGMKWEEVYQRAWEHSRQTGKYCKVRKPLNEDEVATLLARVYERILSWPDNDDDSGKMNINEE